MSEEAKKIGAENRIDVLLFRLAENCLTFVVPGLSALIPIGPAHIISDASGEWHRLLLPLIFCINAFLVGAVGQAILMNKVWPESSKSPLIRLREFLDAVGIGQSPILRTFLSKRFLFGALALCAVPGPIGFASWLGVAAVGAILIGRSSARFHRLALGLLLAGAVGLLGGMTLGIPWNLVAVLYLLTGVAVLAGRILISKKFYESVILIYVAMALAPLAAPLFSSASVYWWVAAIVLVPWVLLFIVQDKLPHLLHRLESRVVQNFNEALNPPSESLYTAQDVIRYSDGYFRRCVARFSQLVTAPGGGRIKATEYGYCGQVGGSAEERLGSSATYYLIRDAATRWQESKVMSQWVSFIQDTLPAKSDLQGLQSWFQHALKPEGTSVIAYPQEKTLVKFPWVREEMVVVPESIDLAWDYPPGAGLCDNMGDPCYVKEIKVRISLTDDCRDKLNRLDPAWTGHFLRTLPLVLPTVYELLYLSLVYELRHVVIEDRLAPLTEPVWKDIPIFTRGNEVQELRKGVEKRFRDGLPKAVSEVVNIELLSLPKPQSYILTGLQRDILNEYENAQTEMRPKKWRIVNSILQGTTSGMHDLSRFLEVVDERGNREAVWNALHQAIRQREERLEKAIERGFQSLVSGINRVTLPQMHSAVGKSRTQLATEVKEYKREVAEGMDRMILAVDKVWDAFSKHSKS